MEHAYQCKARGHVHPTLIAMESTACAGLDTSPSTPAPVKDAPMDHTGTGTHAKEPTTEDTTVKTTTAGIQLEAIATHQFNHAGPTKSGMVPAAGAYRATTSFKAYASNALKTLCSMGSGALGELEITYAVTHTRSGTDTAVCACLVTGDLPMGNVCLALTAPTGMVLAASPGMANLSHSPPADNAIYFIS